MCVAVCCSVAGCCSVLQGVTVCCSVLQCVAVSRVGMREGVCVLQCVAVCCSVLQCVAVYCFLESEYERECVFQCVAVNLNRSCRSIFLYFCCNTHCNKHRNTHYHTGSVHMCSYSFLDSGHESEHVCCSVLQCVAVCCSVLQ